MLPELEIPTFDGDRLQWAEFWNLFQITVVQNTPLSDIEKFCHLKSILTGEAKDDISGILISQENYGVSKTLLEDRFNNAEVVQHRHIMEVRNFRIENNYGRYQRRTTEFSTGKQRPSKTT